MAMTEYVLGRPNTMPVPSVQGWQVRLPEGSWEGRRVRRYPISTRFFEALFRDGGRRCFEITKGTPEDGYIIAVVFDPNNDAWEMIIQSESFDPVPESTPIPTDRFTETLLYMCRCNEAVDDGD